MHSGEKNPVSDDWNLVKRLKFSLPELEIDISESAGLCEDKEESGEDLRRLAATHSRAITTKHLA